MGYHSSLPCRKYGKKLKKRKSNDLCHEYVWYRQSDAENLSKKVKTYVMNM